MPTSQNVSKATLTLTVAIVLLGLVAFVTAIYGGRLLTRVAAGALDDATHLVSLEVDQALSDALDTVQSLATAPGTRALASAMRGPATKAITPPATGGAIDGWLRGPAFAGLDQRRYPSVLLVDPNGQAHTLRGPVDSTSRRHIESLGLPLAQAWSGRSLIVQSPQPAATGNRDEAPVLFAIGPVRGERRIDALLAVQLTAAALLTGGSSALRPSLSDATFLYDAEGRVIASRGLTARPAANRWVHPMRASHRENARMPTDASRQGGIETDPYPGSQGLPVISGWRWLPDFALGIAIERDATRALGGIAQLERVIFGTTLLAASALLILIGGLRLRGWFGPAGQPSGKAATPAVTKLPPLLDQAPNGLISLDAQDRISDINHRIERIFGYTRVALVSQPLSRLFAEDLPDLSTLHAGRRIEINGQRADGQTIPLEFAISDGEEAGHWRRVAVITDISEHKRLERALRGEIDRRRASEHQQRLLLHTAGEGIFGLDRERRVTFINPAAERMLGYRSDELLDRGLGAGGDGVGICDRDCPLLTTRPGQSRAAETRLRRKDGSHFTASCNLSWVQSDGRCDGAVVVFSDITERKATEESLLLAESVFQHVTDGVLVADAAGRILRVNRALREMVGYPEEELVGQERPPYHSGEHPPVFYQQLWDTLQDEGFWEGEIWNQRRTGELFPTWQTIVAVPDENGRPTQYVSVTRDITERRRSELRIQRLAYFDNLTGLPNRELFFDRFAHAIQRAYRQHSRLALLFLDLDRFKNVNDSLGHPIGDRLLQAVGTRLRELVRAEDTVARLGGDEFTVLIESVTSNDNVGLVAGKVVEALSRPFQVDAHELHIGTSVGISLYPEDGDDATTLVKHADAAMYRAKARGRNGYQFFDWTMSSQTRNQIALETRLHRAIHNEEFILHYQPQFAADGRIVAVEALIRWQDPVMGMIPPGRFIALAEETGMIIAIGEWALRAACRQLSEWRLRNAPSLRVSVNLAGPQIMRGRIVETVASVLDETGLPPELLELEVTESFIMDHAGEAVAILSTLRDRGVQIAIDDFGTGHSSLAWVRNLPADTLKIDRAFVGDIPDNRNDVAIVQAILAMARQLGLRTIAEGVETEPQRRFLAQEGCDCFQGFLLSRPLPPEAVESLWQHYPHTGALR